MRPLVTLPQEEPALLGEFALAAHVHAARAEFSLKSRTRWQGRHVSRKLSQINILDSGSFFARHFYNKKMSPNSATLRINN